MTRKILYLAEFVFFVFVLAGCSQKEETQEAYADYLQKIWVAEDWQGEEYEYHAAFSFTITGIEGKTIEGNYCDSLPFFLTADTAPTQPAYTGVIEGETARCTFYEDDEMKEAGALELTFLDSRRIEGKIIEKEGNVQRKYVFRPYTLNDVKGLYITDRFTKEVDTWGEIRMATGITEYRTGDEWYYSIPVYIINESDDVLYEFQANDQVGSRFYEMDVADYDGDGLDDIKIVTYFPYEPEKGLTECIFYQTEEHLFKQ